MQGNNFMKFCRIINIDFRDWPWKIQIDILKITYSTEQTVKLRKMLLCKIQNYLENAKKVTWLNQIYCVMWSHQYVDTDQVKFLSVKENWKRHFMRARPESRFYGNLVCIVLIIGSEVDVTKHSLTTRGSEYIELIFRKRISVLP